MAIAEKLRELRAETTKTQKEIASAIGVSVSTIGMYETGRREPDNALLIKIADFFGVTTDYLLGRTDTPNPVQTIAAHRTDDPMSDLPPEAIQSIEDFKKFVREKYKKN